MADTLLAHVSATAFLEHGNRPGRRTVPAVGRRFFQVLVEPRAYLTALYMLTALPPAAALRYE